MCLTSGALKCSNGSHRRSLLYYSNEFLILPLSLRPRLLPPVVTAWEGGRWHKHGMTEHSWWWKGTVRTSGPTTEMTHTHTWLCVAHTRQTHLPVICVTHSLTHTARPPVLATTQPQGWIHRDKKERKMEKYKGEGRSDTRPAVRMRRILETSKRKRMMQYNKVRADGCEELKRFSQISSFTHPCVVSKPVWVSFFCGIQKEDFEKLYLSPPPPPPCNYSERGLRSQKASERMQKHGTFYEIVTQRCRMASEDFETTQMIPINLMKRYIL